MNICEYGCGQEAKYQLVNGKWCCSESWNKCPELRKKNSHGVSRAYFNNNESRLLKAKEKIQCEYCNRFCGKTSITQHRLTCYLNPINLKLCPICNKAIKDYKHSSTCSNKCKGIFFKDTYAKTSRAIERNHPTNYRLECFKDDLKKCIICDECLVVAVHHFDGNHENNSLENLIPLCPTHHVYCHSQHYHLIKERVERYISQKIERMTMK